MGTTLEIILARKVSAYWFRRGLQTERGSSRSKVRRVLRSVALRLLGHVLVLGDQVVDAFLVLDHL